MDAKQGADYSTTVPAVVLPSGTRQDVTVPERIQKDRHGLRWARAELH